jgi:alkylated DNA repair dioxygenase AlkB
MSYHSDDDIGVQATIAAVSLGAPADMYFRQKGDRTQPSPCCLRITLLHVSTLQGGCDL